MSRRFVEADVISHRAVARDTFVIGYALELDALPRAGQFAMVHPGDDDEYILPRPFSILDYVDGRLDLLVKIAGRASRQMADSRPGDRSRIFAPLGQPFSAPELFERPAILVAGGVGVVPLHMLSREIRARGGPSPVPIFGARTPADLPLELLADEPAGPWQSWVESGATGAQHEGLVTAGLEAELRKQPTAVVATCGPTPMMHAVARITRALDVPTWVCLEEQMGCGAGVCRACVVEDAHEPRMRTVCKEGPVFDLGAIRFLPEDGDVITAEGCSP